MPWPAPGQVRRNEEGAFTLPEALLAIVVLAILIALALPSLAASRREAVYATCLAHARSAAGMMSLYALDHRGYVPYAGDRVRRVPVPGTEGSFARIGGTSGLTQGLWALLFPDEWSGDRFNPGLMCPDQPPHDPALPHAVYGGAEPGWNLYPGYWLSGAFWIDPAALTPGASELRPRAARFSEVTFPSKKALLFEHTGYCIDEPGAEWYLRAVWQTILYRSTVVSADQSAQRFVVNDFLPPASGIGMTVNGVRGRDLP